MRATKAEITTPTLAYYATDMLEEDKVSNQAVFDLNLDRLELRRNDERPILSLKSEIKLQFKAIKFDEIILHNFRMEENLPAAVKPMVPHIRPRMSGTFKVCYKDLAGDFRTVVNLPYQIVAYIRECLTDTQFVPIKFDVLAKTLDGDWMLIDPGFGTKP